MKKGSSLMLASVLLLAALAGCSTGEDNSLVSKTPFPEFSEADTEGNPVSSDIFADYDATIVNFWNNGCGTCIEEMPELEELYHQLQERNINRRRHRLRRGRGAAGDRPKHSKGEGRYLCEHLPGPGRRVLQGLCL